MTDRLTGFFDQKPPRSEQRPQRLPGIPKYPRGARNLVGPTQKIIGPGDPPAGFIIATNSLDEWFVYWGLARVLGWPRDPRMQPFIGFPGIWKYQKAFDGGRRRAGGAVIDFVIDGDFDTVAIRVQSERFHIMATASTRASDELQEIQLGREYRVFDIYSQDYLEDESGQSVIVQLKQGLAGGISLDPIGSGTSIRTRAG